MNEALKPGPGWKRCGDAPVYDHSSGIRIHVMGLCRLRDGSYVYGTHWPESKRLDRFVRINGGNRKRGVMAWSLSAVGKEPTDET